MRLKDKIQARREALRLSQRELARLVGCSHGTIYNLETIGRTPSLDVAKRLAAHLGMGPEEFDVLSWKPVVRAAVNKLKEFRDDIETTIRNLEEMEKELK